MEVKIHFNCHGISWHLANFSNFSSNSSFAISNTLAYTLILVLVRLIPFPVEA